MSQAAAIVEPISERIVSLKISSDQSTYLDGTTVAALAEAAEQLKNDETVQAILVEGGTTYFSNGASREALLNADAQSVVSYFCLEVPRLILSLPVPTVAVMSGHAIGGGLILGLWCDIPILAQESLYGANFMTLGLTPGMGATILLEDALGGPLARELLFTGRLVKGSEIQVGGGPLAHAVLPREMVRRRAMAIAEELADNSRAALKLLKETLSRRRMELYARAFQEESAMHQELFVGSNLKERIGERYAAPLSEPEESTTNGQRTGNNDHD